MRVFSYQDMPKTCLAVVQTGEIVAVWHLGKNGETFSVLICTIAVSTELKLAPGRTKHCPPVDRSPIRAVPDERLQQL